MRTQGAGQTGLMELRDAHAGDSRAIAELHVAAWQAAYRGLLADEVLDGLSALDREEMWGRLVAGSSPVDSAIVAVDEQGIQGFVHVCPSRDPDAGPTVGEVTSIYVHPAHWEHGIGRRLLEAAVGWLAAAGFDAATLWVLDGNRRAMLFYEAQGWAADGSTKDDVREEFTLHERRYAKVLDRTAPQDLMARIGRPPSPGVSQGRLRMLPARNAGTMGMMECSTRRTWSPPAPS